MILNLKIKIKNKDEAFKLVGEIEHNSEVLDFSVDGKKMKINNKRKKKE